MLFAAHGHARALLGMSTASLADSGQMQAVASIIVRVLQYMKSSTSSSKWLAMKLQRHHLTQGSCMVAGCCGVPVLLLLLPPLPPLLLLLLLLLLRHMSWPNLHNSQRPMS
jgi:hypothetical protein